MTINKIIEVSGGTLISGEAGKEPLGFTQDTKKIQDGYIYIGIKGEHTDGNDYIDKAFENGAMGCIIDKLPDGEILSTYKDKVIIYVKNTIEGIAKIAKYKRSLYNIPVVGVTGSVGKTSTKDIIASVLSQKYNVLKTEGNYNNNIGLPLTLLNLREHTAAVIEMGMNHAGEISVLTDIAKPTICVFTNIGTAHIGNLGSRENILKAKLEMLEGISGEKLVVINNDNDLLNDWAKKQIEYDIHTYGIQSKSEYIAYNIKSFEYGSKYSIDIDNLTYKINVPITGTAYIYNSLCAITVGCLLGTEMEKISNGISSFELTPNRMNIQKIENDITIINDSYNANYDSVKAALEVLNNTKSARKIAVLGDMLELGEFSKELHHKAGEEVVKNNADILITVGENAEYIAEKAKELGMSNIYICKDNNEASEILNHIINKGDAVLIKGSRDMKLKEILEKLGGI